MNDKHKKRPNWFKRKWSALKYYVRRRRHEKALAVVRRSACGELLLVLPIPAQIHRHQVAERRTYITLSIDRSNGTVGMREQAKENK